MCVVLQMVSNKQNWEFQMLHTLNMTMEQHFDERPLRRQAEVSHPVSLLIDLQRVIICTLCSLHINTTGRDPIF